MRAKAAHASGGTSVCPNSRVGRRSRVAGEDDQLPPLRLMVVAQDVLRAVVASDLEVAVVGSQPAIDDLGHFDAAVAEGEAAGCLLATVPGIALDAQVHVGMLAQPH